MLRLVVFLLLAGLVVPRIALAKPIDSAAGILAAARDGKEGATIEIAAGTYELDAPLELKAGMTVKGAGIDKTILTHSKSREATGKGLPDPEMTLDGLDTNAYLVRIQRDTKGVTISDVTLRAPKLHGAIFAWFHGDLHVHHVRIDGTMYSGIRTFGMSHAKIHDCEFIDAGGRWDNGQPGVKGGLTGGGIFAVWMGDCEIYDNRFVRKGDAPEREFYGIKGRQAQRCRIHHNTIATGFSIELPFEGDEDVEIDHNVLMTAVSIPKYAGGHIPKSGRSFHIHHNYFRDSYSIEFVRNCVEIDHNLFDFDVKADHGNLISAFGDVAAPGPLRFHNNLVSNPGRGVMWMNEVMNNVEVRNNHVVCRTTTTPRTEGLFGFNPACDFSTFRIVDNRIECEGQTRPLLRCDESYASTVENNELVNVADAEKLKNPKADRLIGLEKPLKFECGFKGETTIDGWKTRPTKAKTK